MAKTFINDINPLRYESELRNQVETCLRDVLRGHDGAANYAILLDAFSAYFDFRIAQAIKARKALAGDSDEQGCAIVGCEIPMPHTHDIQGPAKP